MPHVKAGKLRVVAVGTPQRLPTLPEVGTVAEQGYPGFEASQVRAQRAGENPTRNRQAAAEEAAKAAKSPSVVERFKADDAEAIGSTPEQYGAFIAKEQARWKEVIQKAGVKAD